MKKTCMNCQFYCSSLCDGENSGYHIHDWCKYWQTFIPSFGIADQYEYNGPYYSDIETGDAFCYMFKAKEIATFEDAWFEKNKQENLENRVEESCD